MHRFFLDPLTREQNRITFPVEQARQIQRVLRMRTGDHVVVLDGTSNEYVVRLNEMGKWVTGTIEDIRINHAEPATHLTLFQGLLKGAKYEAVLQKCTEIGVSSFTPMVTDRCIPRELEETRLRRYQTIVREAAEQSGRGIVPIISPPIPWYEALQRGIGRGPVIVLWEDELTTRLRDLSSQKADSVSLLVGPEGGLSVQEVDEARAAGAHTATLGQRILRAETAAIVGSSLLLAHYGDLG